MTMEVAELVEQLRDEIRGLASPWRTRQGAAEYLGCTPALIDMMAAKGELERNYLNGSPRFRVSDLDKLITKKKQAIKAVKEAA